MTRDADRPAASPPTDETFLQRWSRRKHAAAREAETPPVERESMASAAPSKASSPWAPHEPKTAPVPSEVSGPRARHASELAPSPAGETAAEPATAESREPLPPVESLTFESDFTRFLEPHVAEDLKRQALKKLLHDPRFNVMDGLDVYIDDYSVPSPLAPDLVRGLAQARYIFEPPPTRVNADGYVEDVPEDETPSAAEVQNHTTPALCATPPHERRGEDVADSIVQARGESDTPLLQRRGGTRSGADGVVEQRTDHVSPPTAETDPPSEPRPDGDASR